MTTCPSGVNYMHLVDHARAYINETYTARAANAVTRRLLAFALPHSERFRWALTFAPLAKPLRPLLRKLPATRPLAAMLDMAPSHIPNPTSAQSTRISRRRGRAWLSCKVAPNLILNPRVPRGHRAPAEPHRPTT